ncbi:MAG: hypothetical protein QW400_00025 [Candidatus Diapherotrites archaeon]
MASLTEERFYVEPPYHYRPAVAELLVKLRVTTSGFIADLLYLDHKKCINIERYSSDSILLKLVSK